MAYIECKQIVRAFKIQDHEIVALRGIDFTMERGEWVAIVGPSGAGKSSLLNLLGGLDTPTAGQLSVDGVDLLALKGAQLAEYRLHRVGFLWQQTGRNLLGHRSALHNVTLPMSLAGVAPWERVPRAKELLNAVGLAEHLYKRPSQLSGGQQQRVALAVALANQPALLLADEPTGALDRKVAMQVMALLQELRLKFNLTILMVTHDLDIAKYADRVLTLRDGALGQNLTHDMDDMPQVDPQGRVQLPEQVRQHLATSSRFSVEIRPEGVLLRPEADQADDVGSLAHEMVPQDAAPERRGWFRRNRRAKPEKTAEKA
jgi:ABC-type lipoprotein export system ATPase subunit